MQQYIIRNDDGAVVGKFERHTEPDVPTDLSVEKVDNLSKYDVDWDDRISPK